MNKAYLLRNRGEKMEQLMHSIVSMLKENEQGLTGLEIIQRLIGDHPAFKGRWQIYWNRYNQLP